MDAFYASVEQRDFPELRGRPVLVGGDPRSRGVVAAASYEARGFGVRSAMPMAQAIRLCPQAEIRPPRFRDYRKASVQMREILSRYSPLVEPLALDEAFLDVAGCEKSVGSPREIGLRIKDEIRRELALVASVGIGPVKFVAKLASDLGKPDGFVHVADGEVIEFLGPLGVERLWGVGPATLKRLHGLGFRRISQLQDVRCEILENALGSQGSHFWRLARGIDPRAVHPNGDPKSLSHETTFPSDIRDPEVLRAELHELTDQVCARLRREHSLASAVTLKIRFESFQTMTRSAHWRRPTDSTEVIWEQVKKIWSQEPWWDRAPIRLLGVALGGLSRPKEYRQLDLFDEFDEESKRNVDVAVDQIREKFGVHALRSADVLVELSAKTKEQRRDRPGHSKGERA